MSRRYLFIDESGEYVDGIFLPDLAVTVVKDWINGEGSEDAQAARDFIKCLDLTEP